jgi:hypothetical protein
MTDKQINEILSLNLDDYKIDDKELMLRKLKAAERFIINQTAYRSAPTRLFNSYEKLTEIVEKNRVVNPKSDLTLYDEILLSIKISLIFMQDTAKLHEQNEYLQVTQETQKMIIASLHEELQQYRGIETSIVDGSIKSKISAILKKLGK